MHPKPKHMLLLKENPNQPTGSTVAGQPQPVISPQTGKPVPVVKGTPQTPRVVRPYQEGKTERQRARLERPPSVIRQVTSQIEAKLLSNAKNNRSSGLTLSGYGT